MWLSLSLDRALTLVSLLFGAIAIYLAVYFYRKTIRTKLLAIAYTEPIPLVVTFADLGVTYLDHQVKSACRVLILLWNKGTSPIEAGDFLEPIELRSPHPILRLEVLEKDAAVAASLDPQSRQIKIDLLRPGEAVTLVVEIAAESYRPDLQIQMKSADMSTITRALRGGNPQGFAALVLLVLLGLQAFFILSSKYFNQPVPETVNWQELTIGVVLVTVVLLINAGISYVTYKFVDKYYSSRLSPVAWRFFKVQLSAFTQHQKWIEFKKKLEEATR